MRKKNKALLILIKLLIIMIIIELCLNLCDNRLTPILLTSNNSCALKYCEEKDFKNNICIKDNDIIREQWLNNIITFGPTDCRFSKIAKYSNGDILAYTVIDTDKTYCPYFYGLKNNGRPLFIKNNIENPYYPLNDEINKNDHTSFYYYESESLIIKIEESEEEYLINALCLYSEIELYDFKEKSFYFKLISDKYKYGYNYRGPFFNLKDTNNFFYGGIFENRMSFSYMFLVKISLKKEKDSDGKDIYLASLIKDVAEQNEIYGYMLSCFETDSKYIICFYMDSLSQKKYKICLYDENLTKKQNIVSITSKIISKDIFFICIHYEAEIGLFLYYDSIDDKGPYPIITFKEQKSEEIVSINGLDDIQINSYIFNTYLNLNDFIKISKDLFCFSSVSEEKEILYIIIIKIFDNKTKVKIRYYVIRTFGLYNYKFYLDLRLNTFKESITLSSSYCNKTDSEVHYNSLIIFSYPNSTDVNKNIVDEIFEKNQKIEDFVFNFNLSDYVIIENNIFGLVFSKIIIQNINNNNPNNIKLFSSKNNEEINSILELHEGEDIKALFKNYELFNCSFEYVYEVTEPDYDDFEEYPEKINSEKGDDKNFFEKKAYTGRLSYYNLYLNDQLTKDCYNNCELCYDDTDKNCIVCSTNEYNIKINSNDKNYKECSTTSDTSMVSDTSATPDTPDTSVTSDISIVSDTSTTSNNNSEEPTEKNKETSKIIDIMDCIDDEKITSDCLHARVKDDEYKDIYDQVKNKVLNSTTYKGEKKVYTMENLILQISKIDEQNEEDNSNIDLGVCESILKKKYSIDEEESLIIYKSDLFKEDSISSYVQYEIYNPNNLELLNISYCSEEQISISVSLNFNNDSKPLYDSLSSSGKLYDRLSNIGHNIYDSNDSFYNDICVTYTTENGTDMSMSEKNELQNNFGTLNLCQEGCTLSYFNSTNKKATCNCKVKETKTVSNYNDIIFNNYLMNKVFGGFQYSNYLVLKCYKLILDFRLLKKNYGFIFMTIILISLIILLFIYIFKGRKKIEYYIHAILKNKSVYINNRKNLKRKNSKKNSIKNTKKEKNRENINKQKTSKKNNNAPPIKKDKNKILNQNKNQNLKCNNLSKSKECLNKKGYKNFSINIFPINNLNYSKAKKEKKKIKNGNKNIKKSKTVKEHVNIYKLKKKKISKENSKLIEEKNSNKILDLDYTNYQTLNIQELNSLQYHVALLVDKRTFSQYYCSLIRKNQLIIFVFVPIDDYNLISIKISLFLLSFSSYLCVNAFFFDDDTMHQINLINSEKILLYHFPLIIYSSLISSLIRAILKHIALSENTLLSIKRVRKMNSSYNRAKEVRICLKIKFIVFFIVSFLLTIFFWYFISCFCAVYINTQIILIKDSLISFGFSMFYPFGLNLLPTMFRIPALRAKNKDKLCLYKISQILALI